MRVDESWQARVYMSVSSTLIALGQTSSESCMRVDESFFFFQFPCFCSALLPRLIFSFFRLIMDNDLDIACFWFFLSVRQILRNIGIFVEPFIILVDSRPTLMTGQTSQNSH